MLKTPITHEEDLEQLAKENENIVSEMMSHLEEYFKDISTELHKIIYPEIKEDKQEEVP